MIYKHCYLLWIFFYCLSTIYLYYMGIKNNWQELRIKKGLAKNENSNLPKLNYKGIFNNYKYSRNCIKLFIFTCIISLLIFAVFYIGTTVKIFENVTGLVTTFLSLLFVFSLFAGVPINKECIANSNNNEIYNWLVKVINRMKYFAIKGIVNDEIDYLSYNIKSKIKEWYGKDEIELGSLILDINSDFFNEMLPKDCEEGIKELMRQNAFGILKLYSEKDSTLYYKLIKLFDEDMVNYGAKLIDIAEFIDKHEYACKNETMSQIQKRVRKNIVKAKIKKVKRLSTEELANRIENEFELDFVDLQVKI